MTDMSDKFSCIIKNKDGFTIDAINIVGCTFEEADKMAKEMEAQTGNTFILIKDKYLFEAIYILTDKYTDALSQIVELRDNFTDTVKRIVMGERGE